LRHGFCHRPAFSRRPHDAVRVAPVARNNRFRADGFGNASVVGRHGGADRDGGGGGDYRRPEHAAADASAGGGRHGRRVAGDARRGPAGAATRDPPATVSVGVCTRWEENGRENHIWCTPRGSGTVTPSFERQRRAESPYHPSMRFLAIDPGGRRTGLAVGDDETRIVTALPPIVTGQAAQRLADIGRAIDRQGPDALV